LVVRVLMMCSPFDRLERYRSAKWFVGEDSARIMIRPSRWLWILKLGGN